MLLVGDIGGTKALLGLAEVSPDYALPRCIFTQTLPCTEHDSFSPLLARFLGQAGINPREITGGCLAVAGPVSRDGRQVQLTNLPWAIDRELLCDEFGLPRFRLVNDFVAAAAGIAAMGETELVEMQVGCPDESGVRLVIGAGTGLGMAVLVPEADGWRVLPGEAGHTAFAPANEAQAALWAHLRKVTGRCTNEQVISGPGIASIYRFFAADAADAEVLADPAPAAMIANLAAASPTGYAGQAMDIFFSAYGAFAGDMALALMATGGVFITGGIALRNQPQLMRGPFLREFNAKGEQETLARQMPIKIVTDLQLGLKGAVRLALRKD